MIAVDTNILVYAHSEELDLHVAAGARLRELAEGAEPWGLPVFCAVEFVMIVTHPRLFDPPSSIDRALAALDRLVESPTCRVLSPGERFLELFAAALRDAEARGNLVFDAQIVAVCREHGARQLLTLDRDFDRFSGIEPVGLSRGSA